MRDDDSPINRRSVIKTAGSALSTLGVLSGTVTAKRPRSHRKHTLEEVLEKWKNRHGKVADIRTKAHSENKNKTYILVTAIFADGETKRLEYTWHKKSKKFKVQTAGRTYVIDKFPEIKGVSATGPNIEQSGISAQAIGTDEGDGVLPRGATISNPPQISPGERVNGSSANSGQSWQNGEPLGAEEVLSNESTFQAGAYSAGAFVTAFNQAGVQLWYEFQVGYETNTTTPSVQVEFDYAYDAHTAVMGGDSSLQIDAFFHAGSESDVYTQTIEAKDSTIGDYWNGSGSGTANFNYEVRPGGIYRFGFHIDTNCQSISTAVAKADVHQDHQGGVDIGDFQISWT